MCACVGVSVHLMHLLRIPPPPFPPTHPCVLPHGKKGTPQAPPEYSDSTQLPSIPPHLHFPTHPTPSSYTSSGFIMLIPQQGHPPPSSPPLPPPLRNPRTHPLCFSSLFAPFQQPASTTSCHLLALRSSHTKKDVLCENILMWRDVSGRGKGSGGTAGG